MADTTINLPYARFVRQVSNGAARTKYSYQAMQADLLSALKVAAWKAADCAQNEVTTVVNKVAETDRAVDSETGEETTAPSYTVYLQDRFDAFKQGGDAQTETASFCGYAGMAAYRFRLPADYSANVKSVSMRFSAARYLRSGLRVVAVLSDDALPSEDWSTIRGESAGAIVSASTASDADGVRSWGFAAQDSVNTLMDSRAREETLTFGASDFPALGTQDRRAYLWIYVSIEDYEDWWTLYDVRTPRYYSIEGSATLVGSSVAVTFADTVVADGVEWEEIQKHVTDGYPVLSGNVATAAPWNDRDTLATFGGKFACPTWQSGMYIHHVGEYGGSAAFVGRSAGIMSKFPDEETAPYFSFAGRKNVEAAAGNDVPYADMSRFCGVKAERTWSEASSRFEGNYDIEYSVFASFASNSRHASEPRVSGVRYAAYMGFGICPYIVPAGVSKCSRMRYRIEFFTGYGIRAGVNVWRCRSRDVRGPFFAALIQAFSTVPNLYTAESSTVEASMTGDGSATSGTTVSGKADLIGYVPPPNVAGSEYVADIKLMSTVTPGDVLIFAPRIEAVERATTPNVTLTPTNVYLAE